MRRITIILDDEADAALKKLERVAEETARRAGELTRPVTINSLIVGAILDKAEIVEDS